MAREHFDKGFDGRELCQAVFPGLIDKCHCRS
jgi:hypothetical protein